MNSNERKCESKIINIFTIILLIIDVLAIFVLFFQIRIKEVAYFPIIYLAVCNIILFIARRYIKKESSGN